MRMSKRHMPSPMLRATSGNTEGRTRTATREVATPALTMPTIMLTTAPPTIRARGRGGFAGRGGVGAFPRGGYAPVNSYMPQPFMGAFMNDGQRPNKRLRQM
ncbi:unnamed protein product [Leptidea sinapis]|uniref:Uncharacterized protein n=1 Tax=Leptidea sinapis TaxID=189913 RepID=A0A5E4PPR6_9NEOP|nr:unnamed protein product [Leptidea sinapis]